MEVPEAVSILNNLLKSRVRLLLEIDKKRWKPSEKAMAGVLYTQEIDALTIALERLKTVPLKE